MLVAVFTEFAASRKEPLAAVAERIYKGFSDAGLGAPFVRFTFSDSPLGNGLSSVDRVLKRHPELARFVTTAAPMPMLAEVRRISNGPMSPAMGEPVPFETLLAIATGVPRSFPFHAVVMHFHAREFGDLDPQSVKPGESMPGVMLGDSWWVTGRSRSLSALTVVNAQPTNKKLPEPDEKVAAVLAACGKARKKTQMPLNMGAAAGSASPENGSPLNRVGQLAAAAQNVNPEAAQAAAKILLDYRSRLAEIIERSRMPHDLPSAQDARTELPLGADSGPRKPVLDRYFKPMGYVCRGESGTFTLQRRTAGNLTVELYMDVGTWSRSVTAFYHVGGLGFKTSLPVPVSLRAMGAAQYPIGDAARWEKIVGNMAALVGELDRTFAKEIEEATGPSPAWYQPES